MEFDSFLVANRDPFGAVIVGETITLHTQGHAEEVRLRLSLIHISEPTRRTPISYAVFCLKKK